MKKKPLLAMADRRAIVRVRPIPVRLWRGPRIHQVWAERFDYEFQVQRGSRPGHLDLHCLWSGQHLRIDLNQIVRHEPAVRGDGFLILKTQVVVDAFRLLDGMNDLHLEPGGVEALATKGVAIGSPAVPRPALTPSRSPGSGVPIGLLAVGAILLLSRT